MRYMCVYIAPARHAHPQALSRPPHKLSCIPFKGGLCAGRAAGGSGAGGCTATRARCGRSIGGRGVVGAPRTWAIVSVDKGAGYGNLEIGLDNFKFISPMHVTLARAV